MAAAAAHGPAAVRSTALLGWCHAWRSFSSSSSTSSTSNTTTSSSSTNSSRKSSIDDGHFIPPWCLLPPAPASAAVVRSAEFVNSAYSTEQLEPLQPLQRGSRGLLLPEVAVLGRSNVGKSSLINMLVGSKQQLAKVSKTPGKTQAINRFLINRSWYLLDCPGYGYARHSQQRRADWHVMTQQYLRAAAAAGCLADVLLLVDASLPPREADLAGAVWLLSRRLPATLVFTKTDKTKRGLPAPADNITAFRAQLEAAGPSLLPPAHFATSAAAGQGREPLLVYLAQRRAAHADALAAAAAAAVPAAGGVT